jgi:hypothetical protein
MKAPLLRPKLVGFPDARSPVTVVTAARAALDAASAYARVSGRRRDLVPIVQAADFRECDDVAFRRSLHASWRRRVFLERQMCPRCMIPARTQPSRPRQRADRWRWRAGSWKAGSTAPADRWPSQLLPCGVAPTAEPIRPNCRTRRHRAEPQRAHHGGPHARRAVADVQLRARSGQVKLMKFLPRR